MLQNNPTQENIIQEIHSLSTSIDNKVNKNGDIMTGTLTINRSYDPAVVFKINNTSHAAILARDNRLQLRETPLDNSEIAEVYQLPITNTGLKSTQFYNILTSKAPVTIAQGGTNSTTADGAISNLGGVKKSGDTMTGKLSVNSSDICIVDGNTQIGVSPSSDIWGNSYLFTDNNNNTTGQIRVVYRSSGENQTQINSINKNGDTSVENALRLITKNDGTRSIFVTDATIWRNALGASSGIWPTSVGGTGGTDSGWKSISGGTDKPFTGNIYYRKIGKFVNFCSNGLKFTTELTTTSGITIATIPDEYRPLRNYYGPFASTYLDGEFVIYGSAASSNQGNIIIYKNRNISSMTTSMTFYISGSYFIE